MIQIKTAEIGQRTRGICPHSGRRCDRARLCSLSAPDACLKLIQNRVCGCSECKRIIGPCATGFTCFRETKKGLRI